MEREVGKFRDFEMFLSKLGTIPEDKTKFYVRWVRRFLRSCNYQFECRFEDGRRPIFHFGRKSKESIGWFIGKPLLY